MKVLKREVLGSRHSIEIGISSWDSDELSIRNRWDRHNGLFSPHGSSELPLEDLVKLICKSLEWKVLSPDQVGHIVEEAGKYFTIQV